jgi:thymidylate synthase
LSEHVAGRLGVPVGRLDFLVKSAHVYKTEFEYMKTVLARVDAVG